MSRRRRRTQRTSLPEMNTSSLPPDHVGLLWGALILMVGSGYGLYQVVFFNLPRIGGTLWLFFLLIQIFITSITLPIVRYLNVRFTPSNREVPSSGIIVRQSIWIGLFVVTCVWLKIPRSLSLPAALFIAMIFIVVEIFLRMREVAAEQS